MSKLTLGCGAKHHTLAIVAVVRRRRRAGRGRPYAYDSSRDDLIADGVTVGGVDVGGLTRDQAARKSQRRARRPARAPGPVTAAGRALQADRRRALKVRADVDGMVDEAVDRSQRRRPARTGLARRHRRRVERRRRAAGELLGQARSPLRRARCASRRQPRPADATSSSDRELARRSRRDGLQADAGRAAARVEAAIEIGRRRRVTRDVVVKTQAEGHDRRAGDEVPDLPDRRPGRLQLRSSRT